MIIFQSCAAKEERLYKKMKKGKINQKEFDRLMKGEAEPVENNGDENDSSDSEDEIWLLNYNVKKNFLLPLIYLVYNFLT